MAKMPPPHGSEKLPTSAASHCSGKPAPPAAKHSFVMVSGSSVPTRKKDGELELYDLTADPAESDNLADKHPDIVKKLSAKVEAWIATLPKDYVKSKDKDD